MVFASSRVNRTSACANNGSAKKAQIIGISRHTIVGAVCDRAFFRDSAKNVRSQTAPTAVASCMLLFSMNDQIRRRHEKNSEHDGDGQTTEQGAGKRCIALASFTELQRHR